MTLTCTCQACGSVSQAEWSRAGQSIACPGCGRSLKVPVPREVAGGADRSPLMVRFRCPSCQRKFATKADLVGKKIRCSGCGAGVRVPADESIVNSPVVAADPTAMVKFRCPHCKQTSKVPAHRAGEKVHCDGCGTAVRIPSGSGGAAPLPSAPAVEAFGDLAARRPAPVDDGGLSGTLEMLESLEGTPASRRAGGVLLSRSATMEQVRQQAAESAAQKEQAARAKKKKKKRKKAGDSDVKETLILVGCVGAFVGVIAVVAWQLPDLRFPIGGVMCLVGFIVYLLGAAALRQRVAEEGGFQVLLFRFCPPYQWWFVMRNWSDTRDHVAFFGAGLVILALGGAVIKNSPIGVKAAAGDRAYEQARRGTPPGAPPAPVGAAIDDEE